MSFHDLAEWLVYYGFQPHIERVNPELLVYRISLVSPQLQQTTPDIIVSPNPAERSWYDPELVVDPKMWITLRSGSSIGPLMERYILEVMMKNDYLIESIKRQLSPVQQQGLLLMGQEILNRPMSFWMVEHGHRLQQVLQRLSSPVL